MHGQVFTIAKLHYINGVVYLTAQEGNTDISTLAQHSAETTKSGNAKHPKVRVQTLVRLAEGLGLIVRQGKTKVQITELGRRYYDARAKDKWSLSPRQQELLREHILSDPSRSPTIHSIKSLLALVKKGQTGKELAHKYATAIGKQDAWHSDVTFEGFTKFGLDYLKELGFIGDKINLGHFSTSQSSQVPQNRAKNKITSLEADFHEAMLDLYNIAGREIGYWANYFLRSVRNNGGLTTAKKLLNKNIGNKLDIGFQALIDAGRPDLSVESLVLQPEFRSLFTPEELKEAKRRLSLVPKYAKRKDVPKDEVYPDDLEDEKEYTEGAKKRITVNAYERDPKARKACLKKHGYSCKVCGMNFEDIYGEIGKYFIHVHHRKQLAGRRSGYKVNPTKDLVPVCPNCHAMLHTSSPPLGIEELKERMKSWSS